MMDIRPFMNMELHITVWFYATCKNCRKTVREKIFDYGKLIYRELEKEMDETKHQIKNIICQRCGTENIPEKLIYQDEISDLIITELPVSYGNMIDAERIEEIEKAHNDRFAFFKQHEETFWKDYTDYALANWRVFINELNDFEIKDAYQKLGIKTSANTLNQLKKDVLNRFKKKMEKEEFWKEANHYFIYNHLLELGFLAWDLKLDIKDFGENRIRFIILHFPLNEVFEESRTEWIGQIIKWKKGDNDFLFRRISMLTNELNRTRNKIDKYVHHIEMLKLEKAKLEEKLSKAYADLRKEKEKEIHFERDPDDIRKIRQWKSFAEELLQELRQKEKIIQELQPKLETVHEAVTLEEKEDPLSDIGVLADKKVFIIGGNRKEQSQKEYPCEIMTHTGEKRDPTFYQLLSKADVIIILTQFISHLTMWEAKAYATDNDIPIYYMKGLNIPNLLQKVSDDLKNTSA